MKKEFKPIYKKEEIMLLDNEYLSNVICSQELEIHNLHNEIREILKEWKQSIKSK